jgi:hypothetical protein
MKKLLLAVLLLSLSACAFAQQDYVGRYDAFAGFSFLDSPKLDLQQRGFNTQIGTNLRSWLAFGFDYSIQMGHASLVPNDLKTPYANALNGLVLEGKAGLIPGFPTLPANYVLYAPFSATTQTFTLGPQLEYRHFKKATFFIHPSIGAMHEKIDLHPHDAFTTYVALPAIIKSGILSTLLPSDTTYFYGLGGGGEYNATQHVHIRADVEFVHVYLYSGILADSRNSIRLSVGPTLNFGKNIMK